METFISYAEYLEDLILYDALKRFGEGFYIDIGAFDPIDISVTKAFSLRGWRGINVEPLKDKFALFELDRPRDINIQMAISNYNGVITLFEAEGASTVEAVTLKSVKKNNALTGSNEVATITMEKLVKDYLPRGKDITFLKIDVEGHEEKVLESMNFTYGRPIVIVVESVIPWKGTPAFEKWEYILFDAGYTFAHDYRNNRYYLNKTHSEIRFRKIEELLKDYRIFIISEVNNKYRLSYMAIESVFAEHPNLKLFTLRIIRLIYPFVSKYLKSFVK